MFREWTIRKMSKKKEDEILEDLESAPEPIYGEDLGTKTVSKLLVEARQSLNLSQKEIADQLYLTKTLIQQLEEGEFGDRSTKAFVKGYLRSYARVVGLSADDLIQRFEEEQKEKRGTSKAMVSENLLGKQRFSFGYQSSQTNDK